MPTTQAEAARILRVTPTQVQRLIASGRLVATVDATGRRLVTTPSVRREAKRRGIVLGGPTDPRQTGQ